ncbi:MAG: hypothetical protein ACLPHI_01115 [Terriglobales bacterium]|jgi:hypothetical protein
MKTFPSPSKPANLGDSLHQHLHLYALAASAAGVSVLALAQPGEAEIVYTPVQVTIGPGQTYSLDLNQDGIVDFTLKNHSHGTTSGFDASLFVRPAEGNAVAGHITRFGFNWAYALGSGMLIDKVERHFAPGRASMAYSNFFLTQTFRGGSWLSSPGVQARFLGLRFKIDGKLHYGWARLNVRTYFTQITATLTGYAFETIPDKPIKAGAEQGTDESVEQPGPAAFTQPAQKPATLGMLALGSPALSIWRRKESAPEGK